MAFTIDDLTALDRAIASGELTVRTADRLVEYRSTDDLLKARDRIAAELAASTTRLYPRHQLADFSDE